MRSIELLDKATIDKIAAGEVVERPASVIKELTENAIDAASTAITIEIRDGGTTFMRITDNGAGIPADQVRRAFLRHATSKIRKVEDLTNISSLGFRGEALSSIAAVAQVECITKTPEALTGIRYTIEGGEEKEYEEIGAPEGTTFIIRNLFYNTPARAKFLKSPMSEGNHVSSFVEELALSHPEISFKFIQNGQNRLYTSGNGNLKEIVYQIFGRDLTRELIPIHAQTDLMEIDGFIGNPNVARGNRNYEYYFVNGRYVKSRLLAKTIEDAYHGFLMQHKYPFTLLYLNIDGEKVDVNVHPQKMEVRFSSQEDIYHQLCLAIQNTLMNRERIPEVPVGHEPRRSADRPGKLPVLSKSAPEPFERVRRMDAAESAAPTKGGGVSSVRDENGNYRSSPRTDIPTYGVSGTSTSDRKNTNASPRQDTDPVGGFHRSATADNAKSPEAQSCRLGTADRTNEARPATPGTADRTAEARPATPGIADETAVAQPAAANSGAAAPRKQDFSAPEQMSFFTSKEKVLSPGSRKQFRIIGQIFDTYWIIEYQDALYIIDQHAAHEKVNYERMMKNYREKKINAQMLYPAIVVNLSAKEAGILEKNLDVFAKLGFEIESFGGNSFKINSVPDNLYSIASDRLFTEILDQLTEIGDVSPESIPEKIASMSCKAAVKGNSMLSLKEADALIDELLTLENPYNCPHGRPTIIKMTKYDLDRKFKRIV
ncbi:DNA mismatch repair endonuclease MutL [Bilifractor sp. HCP3S3_D3]|uniref:DNA mismatch repair endonuclease MutL n=1 Tax=unclassified Bilifractor TaxID=2815795 RepID=UPI003F8CC7C3